MQRETAKEKAPGRGKTTKAKKARREKQVNGGGAAAQATIPLPKTGSPVIDWARFYITRGLAVVTVPYREKGPNITDWPKLIITLENVDEYFRGQLKIGS